MDKYADVAMGAVRLIRGGCADPIAAWNEAAERIFPTQEAARKKSCPRSAFLGLCEEGLVKGVRPGRYTKSEMNKQYALRAVEILQGHHVGTPGDLWKLVMAGRRKKYNSQMDVVLALWKNGQIQTRRRA